MTETVNDLDGMISNFWRSVQADPETTAKWAAWPVNENDLTARHHWLKSRRESLRARLEGDPDWCDPKIAGWWCWGVCAWIGSGFCSADGPWVVAGGELVDSREPKEDGVKRQRPHLGNRGQGINRQLPHLGRGRGVNRQGESILEMFTALQERLRSVRVCCGDWSRVCGPSPTFKLGLTAVYLDPPYSAEAERTANLYAEDCLRVAHDVREWAIANGDNPLLRIALCGYSGEHVMPDGWTAWGWKTRGGYGSRGDGRGRVNAGREVVLFSPHCLGAVQTRLAL